MAELLQNIKIEVTVHTNKNVYPATYNLDDYDKLREMLQEFIAFVNENTGENYRIQ